MREAHTVDQSHVIGSPLDRGDQIPHFDLVTIEGRRVRYRELWQRTNLVLVMFDPKTLAQFAAYAARLRARRGEFTAADTALVISSEPVPGLTPPCVLIADRWGEVVRVFRTDERTLSLPNADDLLEWITFVRMQCPECPA